MGSPQPPFIIGLDFLSSIIGSAPPQPPRILRVFLYLRNLAGLRVLRFLVVEKREKSFLNIFIYYKNILIYFSANIIIFY
jgi:hypothetical protein